MACQRTNVMLGDPVDCSRHFGEQASPRADATLLRLAGTLALQVASGSKV